MNKSIKWIKANGDQHKSCLKCRHINHIDNKYCVNPACGSSIFDNEDPNDRLLRFSILVNTDTELKSIDI